MSVAQRACVWSQLCQARADICSATLSETCMTTVATKIRTLDDLKSFVRTALCEKENLLIDQTVLRQSPLIKQGRMCGYQFSIQGPRQVRLGAVWASDCNDVYFYDTRGNRYAKVRLPEPIAITESDQE
jgi:hypothetical protein